MLVKSRLFPASSGPGEARVSRSLERRPARGLDGEFEKRKPVESPLLATTLTDRRDLALRRIRELGRVVVALSGGVDSAVLLALAVEAVGRDRVVAATGRSASLADSELQDARKVATLLCVPHEVVDTHEMENTQYRANAGDRCYHCRTELFDVLQVISQRFEASKIVFGAILDDLQDDRPGMRAAEEHGVVAPLLEARISKDDVRQLAKERGLTVADKPASPCLASRVPVGDEVTTAKLRQIGAAESLLRELGFAALRVRHHGEVARIEVDRQGALLLGDDSVRSRVVEGVKAAGFRFVTLDLCELRSGSLNPPRLLPLHRIEPARPKGQ